MLRAVCLLALVAAAHARPDTAPAPAPAPAPSESTQATIANEVPVADVVSQSPAPLSLHQQHPHAVLFGGTCGGTIIDAKWILTAAHCTLFTRGRHVLAGTGTSDDGSGVVRKVKKLYIHPLFAVGPYWVNSREFNLKQVHARWDYMLVELESPLPLDGLNMAAVPLDQGDAVPEGLAVDYAGYGADHHGGVMRPNMHVMKLRTVGHERCSSLPQYDNQDMVCAEGRTDTRDSACNGDSGSGLVSKENRRLVGVASWVQDDANECSPGKLVVFSRVAAARPWLKDITGLDL